MKRFPFGRQLLVVTVLSAMLACGFLLAQAGSGQTRGDYNGDGSVGMSDVFSLLLKIRAGGSVTELDYNLDGIVGGQDAVDLLLDILWRGQSVMDVVVTPQENNDLLMNPGVGFESPGTTNEAMNRWNPKYPNARRLTTAGTGTRSSPPTARLIST